MRLAPIKSRVPLGSSIRVTMYAGEPIEGTLFDIDDECLIISDLRGSEIILEANAIAMVVRLSSGADDTSSTGQGAGSQGLGLRASAPPVAASPSRPILQHAALPTAAVQAFAELELQVRATSLEIPAIDWDVYDGHFETELRMQFRRDLVAVRNRYEYAVKTKEEDRVLRCVAGLRKIADDYEAPDALQIAGRMLWRLGRREQGRVLFVDATQARNDSLYCFDLAMAQRLTGELDHAAATLRHCLREDSQPRALALMALTAIVLTEDTGWAELAGLVQDAAHWRAGVARLAVLHCGLICVSRADLTGFPGDQWDSADAAPEAFATLAQALHAGATPSATAGAPASPSGTGTVPAQTESAASAATDAGPIEAAAVKALAVEVHACLNRRDVLAAERAFAQLKRVAPQDSLTWGAERALSNARSRGASAGPVPGPPRGSVRWPALPVLRVAVDAVRQMGVLRTLLVDGWNHYLATRA